MPNVTTETKTPYGSIFRSGDREWFPGSVEEFRTAKAWEAGAGPKTETIQAVEFRNAAGEMVDLWRGVVVDVVGGKGLRVGNGSVYKIGPNDVIVPVDPQLFPTDELDEAQAHAEKL